MCDSYKGRKERLRNEDKDAVISCSILSSLYCYQVCKGAMVRQSHAHAYRGRLA